MNGTAIISSYEKNGSNVAQNHSYFITHIISADYLKSTAKQYNENAIFTLDSIPSLAQKSILQLLVLNQRSGSESTSGATQNDSRILSRKRVRVLPPWPPAPRRSFFPGK